jgi:hypothetical protein
MVPGSSADRYDEVALSADDKEEVAPLKLSKSELRNLLPSVRQRAPGRAGAARGSCSPHSLDGQTGVAACWSLRRRDHALSPPGGCPTRVDCTRLGVTWPC